jgi:hypothetical protein
VFQEHKNDLLRQMKKENSFPRRHASHALINGLGGLRAIPTSRFHRVEYHALPYLVLGLEIAIRVGAVHAISVPFLTTAEIRFLHHRYAAAFTFVQGHFITFLLV